MTKPQTDLDALKNAITALDAVMHLFRSKKRADLVRVLEQLRCLANCEIASALEQGLQQGERGEAMEQSAQPPE